MCAFPVLQARCKLVGDRLRGDLVKQSTLFWRSVLEEVFVKVSDDSFSTGWTVTGSSKSSGMPVWKVRVAASGNFISFGKAVSASSRESLVRPHSVTQDPSNTSSSTWAASCTTSFTFAVTCSSVWIGGSWSLRGCRRRRAVSVFCATRALNSAKACCAVASPTITSMSFVAGKKSKFPSSRRSLGTTDSHIVRTAWRGRCLTPRGVCPFRRLRRSRTTRIHNLKNSCRASVPDSWDRDQSLCPPKIRSQLTKTRKEPCRRQRQGYSGQRDRTTAKDGDVLHARIF